ncbi:hypothetical protein GF323_00960 [Candidatus Woesearchaeota archaeon]|nr:hypothetical protein [Candidatus Woesearchaeota archaeon]
MDVYMLPDNYEMNSWIAIFLGLIILAITLITGSKSWHRLSLYHANRI